MTVHFFRTEHEASDLRRLARRESGRVCQRMMLMANLLDGMERDDAARLAGLGRQAAYDWHNRYEEEGIDGLRDRPRPQRRRVGPAAATALKERIEAGADLARDGVVAFRGVDVQRILKVEHGIQLSLSSVYRELHRLKLSWLAPRPRHPRSDEQAQTEFRQLLDYNFNESRRRKRTADESRCGSPTRRGLARRTR